MHYFISAGEASGDLHASELISALRALDPQSRFTFLGGDAMTRAAGHGPLIHFRDMAYMGFIDVALHLRSVLGNLSTARNALVDGHPDALILVDYPSFNLKLAKTAASLGIPVFWYISPKVWAWKTGRVKDMRRLVKKVYSILPFEPEFLCSHGVENVLYVGNPSLEEVDRRLATLPFRDEWMKDHMLDPGIPLLAIVPGSRVGEIRDNLPVMAEVARRHPDMQAVVAGAPSVDMSVYDQYGHGLTVIKDASFELMRYARAALVTSGTATLECALSGTPQVACYRSSGWPIVHKIFEHILKIPFVTLPNLIAGQSVIPELLIHHVNPDETDAALRPLLGDTPQRQAQIEGYALMRRRLGTTMAAATCAADLYDNLTHH